MSRYGIWRLWAALGGVPRGMEPQKSEKPEKPEAQAQVSALAAVTVAAVEYWPLGRKFAAGYRHMPAFKAYAATAVATAEY